mgnify:CR=1 FL=1
MGFRVGSADKIKDAGSSLKSTIEDIAKDPKQLMFGIAKMAASEGLNLAKSRLVAAPLSKVLCKKHLVSSKGGNVDDYLKHLGVVPNGNGSYIDGLDFSNSTLFPYGSNEITVDVSYDVKVIALLPMILNFLFIKKQLHTAGLQVNLHIKVLKNTKKPIPSGQKLPFRNGQI